MRFAGCTHPGHRLLPCEAPCYSPGSPAAAAGTFLRVFLPKRPVRPQARRPPSSPGPRAVAEARGGASAPPFPRHGPRVYWRARASGAANGERGRPRAQASLRPPPGSPPLPEPPEPPFQLGPPSRSRIGCASRRPVIRLAEPGAERARDPLRRLAAAVAGGCGRACVRARGGGAGLGRPPWARLLGGGGWRPLRPLPSRVRALAALPRLSPPGPARPRPRWRGEGLRGALGPPVSVSPAPLW